MSGKGFFAAAFLGVASIALLALSSQVRAQQPPVRTLTEQEIMDMMLGSSIQASRGANTQQTVDRMKAAIAQGRKFTMIVSSDHATSGSISITCRSSSCTGSGRRC